MTNYVECKICGSCISLDTDCDCIFCTCGAIAVDGGPGYYRILGDKDNYEIVLEEEEINE